MVNLKILKPYNIKVDPDYVEVYLEQQSFSLNIGNKVYHFVPLEAKKIKINRETQKIENLEAKFAFQNGEKIIYIAMIELIYHPDFLIQVYNIAHPYYHEDHTPEIMERETDVIVDELERMNKRRLIDKALDERDEEQFYELIKLL